MHQPEYAPAKTITKKSMHDQNKLNDYVFSEYSDKSGHSHIHCELYVKLGYTQCKLSKTLIRGWADAEADLSLRRTCFHYVTD